MVSGISELLTRTSGEDGNHLSRQAHSLRFSNDSANQIPLGTRHSLQRFSPLPELTSGPFVGMPARRQGTL